jgi:PAS domain S-box-containing protein
LRSWERRRTERSLDRSLYEAGDGMSEPEPTAEALRASEERFRAFVTASSDVVYRMSPDWSEMRLLRGREFIADTDAPTRDWLEKYIHPDDQPRVLAAIAEAVRTRSTFQLEHRVLRVDGSLGWTFSRAIPLFDESGAVVEWFGAASDITPRKRAEEELRASERRLALAQQVARAGAFDWNIETGVNTWTPELEGLYGLPPGGFGGTEEAWERLVHPDDRAEAVRRVDEALATGATMEHEWRVVWPDGSVHWLTSRWQVLKDEMGKPLRMTGINMDVTERKQAEQQRANDAARDEARERELAAERAERAASERWSSRLARINEHLTVTAMAAQEASEREATARAEAERREQELEALFASLQDGVLVYGEDGHVRKVNEAATELFGADVRGLTAADLIERFQIASPDETGLAGALLPEDRLPGSRAMRGEVVSSARLRLRTPAGARTFLVSSSPLYREAPSRGALSVYRDVTDYERAAEEVRRAAEQLRLSHDAIFVWHLHDGGIESWNRGAEDLYGFGGDEASGRHPKELLRTRFPQPWVEIERELTQRRRWEGELVQTTQDGRTVIVSAKLQLIRHADGVEHVLEVNRDITDRKRAEDALRERERQLREADRRKDEFLAVLSHELRNPLAPIHNSLYVLDRAPPGGEQARHAKEVIERQTNQLTRLVADLLDVSRISRGKVLLQRERVDLRQVVQRTLEDHLSVYAVRGIRLRGDEPARPVWADADPARLAQALTNLLHNAAKYTKEGGEVVVTLRQERDTAVLQVRDDGAGIATDMLPRIFEPFAQGKQALDRSAGGLGLGLALVKGLVELHGGDVTVRSDGVGRGAEFTLRIPAERAAPSPPRPELKLVQARGLRVLVIEDNVDAAETLKDVLEYQGHEVAVAFNGPGGLEKARAFMPDLVLCDIGLPGMDGYEVARAFRADDRLEDVPLIAMTGYALAEDQQRAAQAGFDRHLAKPVDLAVLERVLAELPARRAG